MECDSRWSAAGISRSSSVAFMRGPAKAQILWGDSSIVLLETRRYDGGQQLAELAGSHPAGEKKPGEHGPTEQVEHQVRVHLPWNLATTGCAGEDGQDPFPLGAHESIHDTYSQLRVGAHVCDQPRHGGCCHRP